MVDQSSTQASSRASRMTGLASAMGRLFAEQLAVHIRKRGFLFIKRLASAGDDDLR